MKGDSKMLEVIRQIGEAAPPPMRLNKLFESPEQEFFSFCVSAEKRDAALEVFDLLAQSSVNIRFISQHFGEKEELRVQLCVDSGQAEAAMDAFRPGPIATALEDFQHERGARILSVYPFEGRPGVAERIIATMSHHGVEVLGINSATSVVSCVIAGKDLQRAVAGLKHVFVLH